MNRKPQLISLALVAAVAILSAKDAPVTLRGYGAVQAEFAPGQAIFRCTDAAHADILLGKLLADLFWDAGNAAAVHRLNVDGGTVVAHVWEPYGLLVAGRIGSEVLAVGAADESALRVRLRRHPELLHAAFEPARPYPRYLDHYDLRAYQAYTGAMSSARNLGLESHWPFLKKFGMGGVLLANLEPHRQFPAPGVINFVTTDYEMHMADQQGGVGSIGLAAGGEVPLWIYNRMPDAMMRPSPTTLMGAWSGTGPVGAHYESWSLSPDQRTSTTLWFMRQVMEHYRDNPALSNWHLYAGSPGVEFAFHDRADEFWDYSPVGEAGFRTWLRDVRKYDLRQLGIAWYGDPRHFTSWDQVRIPDVNAFFGGTDASSVRLADGWQWASARIGVVTPPPAAGPAWMPVAMPPSQQQVLLPWGEAFYRIEFDGSEWAARPQVWLACNALVRSSNPTVVWLNGAKLFEAPPDNAAPPFAVSLAGKLQRGRNELILRVPRNNQEVAGATEIKEGKLFGPVFLTASEPKRYPYLGEHANARYADVREWQMASMTAVHRVMFDEALALDPDHPYTLSGSAAQGSDSMAELAEDYGSSLQHTGREAWYHPFWTGLGLLGGFYGTSEESATASTAKLTRELGWMLIDGDSNHDLYWNIEDYQLEEQRTGWFTRHQRAIQCYGKYLRVMPRVAILRSARNLLMGSREPWNWDLGRGELQAAHFDNAYATETELLKGLTDASAVLIDAGTEVMDDDVVQALRRYIERGGTFVALHQTGRHTRVKQDAQPLSRLTGLTAVPHAEGKVRIENGAPILAAWAGREFGAHDMGLIPAAAGVAVPGGAPVAVARWDDGTIALAVRRIGKGQIIQLGSSFWRDGKVEAAFLERLLTDLGVRRDADASRSAVWARKTTTKNGLQHWLVTYNSSDAETTADVRLAVEQRPAAVWELLTGKPVEFTFSDGFVTVPGVHYDPQEVHLFAIKRADLADALPFWWEEKVRYWKLPRPASSARIAVARNSDAVTENIPFLRWGFLADRDGAAAAKSDWLQPGFDDRAWKQMDNGPWNLLDPALADWSGAGLYRKTFTVPNSWEGQRVILNLFDWDRPIIYDQGEILVNGVTVAKYKAHGWSQAYAYDVTSLLRKGVNVLAVRVEGGKQFSGICGSIWLEPELRFATGTDLSGTWRVVKADFRTGLETQLPGKPSGRYLARDIDLPAAWTGRTVYLHLETETQWLGCIVVNGQLITTNGAIHPFSPRLEVNLTPYLVPGKNHFELWPYATVPSVNPERSSEAQMPVTTIRLGIPLVE